ncbi:inositol monophosphatase [Salipiger sp. PrR002]|uniref:inositol monophosphatase family protein n=1 Tax=Salipiger sp. PrR002 TaxID=2706489 RepID=UPI0013BC4B32|nr:inositol monophosphatase [Salipiger sp. PrR002]NDV98992.1 inositol monophosphatase [Salipiger sp. PrR002]NDW55945.1 inositol monophosphatase [Salipiger sp. PrR004]
MTDSLPMPISAPISQAQRTSILNLLRRAAKTEILPRFRSLDPSEVSEKTGRQDLVTAADKGAEAMIARGLQRMYPHALIVGEEAVAEHPEIRDKIGDAELAFTIDPVDGTWNYAHGLSTFGIILSATRFGVPVFGMIYDPIMDDVMVAEIGGEAKMLLPKRRLTRHVSVSAGGKLEELQGFIPFYLMPEDKRAQVGAALPLFERSHTLRCSAHEFRLFAQGSVDFLFSARLTPWDHAAGALISRCAGGHVAMLDGSEYNAATRDGVLLCASNKETWERIRDAFSFLLETPAEG